MARHFGMGRDAGRELEERIREQFKLGTEKLSIQDGFLLEEDMSYLLYQTSIHRGDVSYTFFWNGETGK